MRHILIIITSLLLLISPLFGQSVKQSTLYYNPKTLQYQTTFIHPQYPVYVGEVRNGVPHGQGTFSLVGYKYVGEWKDGLKHGQGTETYRTRDKYVGEFKDGKRNSQGTYIYSDGGKYEGEWKDVKQHGQGTFTFGKVKWEGNKYIGEFKDGASFPQL